MSKSGITSSTTGLIVLPSHAISEASLSISPLPSLSPSVNSSTSLDLHLVHDASNTGKPLSILEINKFNPSHGTYFIVPSENSIPPTSISNGSLTFLTKVDPLFAAIPFLVSNPRPDVFQPCADLLLDSNVRSLIEPEQLALICDVKLAMGEQFYRLSESKLFKWLDCKIQNVLDSKCFIKKKEAVDLVACYVPDDFAKRLRDQFTEEEGDKRIKSKEEKQNEEEEEENGTEAVEQTEGDAADLAMSVMQAEARANKEYEQQQEYQQYGGGKTQQEQPRKQPARKASTPVAPSASAMKFWASHSAKNVNGKSKGKGDNNNNSTKKKSSSGNKRKRT